ncbi:hypothetical protein O6U65_1285 [Saccharomyces cerevisiae synthetic construct]|uniref:Putative uncharacterized protein YJL009W n=1 Tax=Saccharomyces cerevisiae (strain ATCC 204508 / S288c) TaxID=559292 RepID=YJC2_YEAST|nr:RecName: Full=Putative uncharacterized protein YJL009W [Saccharomyces cerevisiae S288C]WNV73383.1 hypothetical protein O6U65_1285 [Saccharomyces cerevisiae synthetic construct]CAA89314.1 unnamed protein product [Saccharomyces cerevisiae]
MGEITPRSLPATNFTGSQFLSSSFCKSVSVLNIVFSAFKHTAEFPESLFRRSPRERGSVFFVTINFEKGSLLCIVVDGRITSLPLGFCDKSVENIFMIWFFY